jgi:hypothetical protein
MIANTAPGQVPFMTGFQGGLSIASTRVDPEGSWPGLGSQTGVTIGVFASIRLADFLYIQPEIQFVQRGAKQDAGICTGPGGPQPLGQSTVTIKYDYLTLPLLVVAKFQTGQFVPFVFVGPDIAFRVRAEMVLECANLEPEIFAAEDQISIRDFSLDFGAGVEYQLTKVFSILLNGRYNLGLTNINEALFSPSWKSRGGQVLLGVGVGI